MHAEYDPYSHQAMLDPMALYKSLREAGSPVYLEKYNAWALARYEDILEASVHHESDVTFTAGQTPAQVLLGEMIPVTFATMDAPEHRKWRGVVRKAYTPDAVNKEQQRFRQLAREVLQPLLAKGEMNVYADYTNKVFALNSGYNLGLPANDALKWRALIDGMLHREPGQKGGTSDINQQSAGELFTYLGQYVASIRQQPELASGHTKAYLEANIDGHTLSDEELTYYLFSFLVLGSETTPMMLAGAIYYLSQSPEQKQQVLNDHSLVPALFRETNRYDQPTNMLCRRARNDFTLGDASIKAGQNLLYIYASANRDESVFENADVFDIHRSYDDDMTFGAGGHKCLGMHLAAMGGHIILEELLQALSDWELVEEKCERAYGEHLSGFLNVTIRWDKQHLRAGEQ